MTAADVAQVILAVAVPIGAYVGGRHGADAAVTKKMRAEVAAGIAAHEQRCAQREPPPAILTPSGRWPLASPQQ